MAAARLALKPPGTAGRQRLNLCQQELMPAVVAVDLASTWSMWWEKIRGDSCHMGREKRCWRNTRREGVRPKWKRRADLKRAFLVGWPVGSKGTSTAGFYRDCGVGHIPGTSLPNSASAKGRGKEGKARVPLWVPLNRAEWPDKVKEGSGNHSLWPLSQFGNSVQGAGNLEKSRESSSQVPHSWTRSCWWLSLGGCRTVVLSRAYSLPFQLPLSRELLLNGYRASPVSLREKAMS